jgi:SanA protein
MITALFILNIIMISFFKKVILASLILAIALIANYFYIKNKYEPTIISEISNVPKKYTAIVFGAGIRKNNAPSLILQDRLDAAIELYKAQKVNKLLLSGDNRKHTHDEPLAMYNYLVNKGIPADSIFLDYAGFDTYSTLYRAKHVFLVKDAVLVSQAYHLRRSAYIANGLGLDVASYTSTKRGYAAGTWYAVREVIACAKASINLLLHSKPKFLGEPINIYGKGNNVAAPKK